MRKFVSQKIVPWCTPYVIPQCFKKLLQETVPAIRLVNVCLVCKYFEADCSVYFLQMAGFNSISRVMVM